MEFYNWERHENIGESASIVFAGRQLDMLVTVIPEGVEADVVDGADVVWRGVLPDMAAAKAEAVAQARRRLLRTV